MTSKEFSSVLNYPGTLNTVTLPALEDLVLLYPWYSTAQLVLAKNLLQIKHVKYPAKLKLASAATIDRSLLKKFLLENQELPPVEIKKEEELIHTDSSTELPILQTSVSSIVNTSAENVVSTKVEEELTIGEDEMKVQVATSENQSLQPIKVEFKQDISEELPSEQLSNEPIPFEPYIQVDFTTELLKLPILESNPEQPIEIKENEPISSGKMSFAEWLKKSNSLQAKTPDSTSENNANGIIERFLEEKPRITKPKHTEFFKPQEAAKKSLSLPEGLVTETLAKIYENQGHFERAIHAYEKLSVKHPEKITYFAARISKLKERLKE